MGFSVLFVPNSIRNYVWLHNPLYNVNSVYSLVWYTSAIAGKSQEVFSMAGLNIDPIRFIAAHPAELLNKIQFQLGRTIDQLLGGGVLYPNNRADGFLILLFTLSVLAPPANEKPRPKILPLAGLCDDR